MYSEWASLQHEIQNNNTHQSVLHKFPAAVGKDVSCCVVKHIAQSSAAGQKTGDDQDVLGDNDIQWSMEVICYGLSLPLSEMDTIKECVTVYCDWLDVLTTPKPGTPKAITDDPNTFSCKIIQHLLNLFVPRPDAGIDLVKRQAIHCHRVLRKLQSIAKESAILNRATWDTLLKFLLAANDSLLSPPVEKGDISDQLCERTITVLYETWLLACHRLFPSPPLWKTFREMSVNWRHHEAVISQWHRVNHILASRLIKGLYGASYPELHISDEDAALIHPDMTHDCVSQTWFRFLHILQNPVDLCHPDIISQTPTFHKSTYGREVSIDPAQHECLDNLPVIFFKAMRGVSIIVNAFLGIKQSLRDDSLMSYVGAVTDRTPVSDQTTTPPTSIHPCQLANVSGIEQSLRDDSLMSHVGAVTGRTPAGDQTTTPPSQRKSTRFSVVTAPITQKVARSTSASSTMSSLTSRTVAVTPSGPNPHFSEIHLSLAPNRPTCNSILHLFGAWLFEAAIARVGLHASHANTASKRTSLFSESSSTTDSTLPETPTDNTYESGRAEACGTLCRIFSTHKTGEDILAVYLSRFYIIMYYGLQTGDTISGQVLSNILFNSCDLLRVDLAGVQILVPYYINAIELVLADIQPKFNAVIMSSLPVTDQAARPHEQIPNVELRKACIHLLLSTVCLPLHLKNVHIKDIVPVEGTNKITCFASLKGRVVEILHKALLRETDTSNTQMLLGGLLLMVQDIALHEESEEAYMQPSHDLPLSTDSDTSATDGDNVSTGTGEHISPDSSFTKFMHPSSDMDSATGLFGHAISLVCNRLMASWKMELTSALAAMEVLSGLAKVKLREPSALMCKRTVKWICDFIVFQCSRPAPSHSRDLHSMIVAAFKCLTLWLVEHSTLLHDKECLHCVLEVVELGISGSKSQNRATDPPKYKGDKQLMPASMRVKDAAEGVLTCIIDHVGSFPPPCGPASLYSLLDEKALLRYARGTDEHRSQFRYFVVDNCVVIGLLEQPLGNVQDPHPTVTALVRGPFGRHAWTMQMRHCPRVHKVGSKAHLSDPGRPMPMDGVGVHHNVKHKHFPDIVDNIALTQADRSIPSLESLRTDKDAQQLDMLRGFIQSQTEFENHVKTRHSLEANRTLYPNPETECKPPSMVHEYQTARLFLSHYSCLSLDALKEPSNSSLPPDLVMLDSSNDALFHDLDCLDTISSRENNTVHLFYVKSGQKTAEEIVKNVSTKSQVQSQFLEFIHSLGWPISVKKHPGWTGHISTSWKNVDVEDAHDDHFTSSTGGSVYDGRDWVLYWADIANEAAFICPSLQTYLLAINSPSSANPSDKHHIPGVTANITCDLTATKPRYLALDVDTTDTTNVSPRTESIKRGQLRRQPEHMTGPNVKVFVVWVENFEDHNNFPTGELLKVANTGMEHQRGDTNRPTEKDVYLIFLHPLLNGLFRVHIQGHLSKIGMATPLVDGMVVSRRTLGYMVRQTAINMHSRKRLESEAYHPPHVRRKLKIQDIVFKYHMKLSEAEFYTALFEDVSNTGHKR